MNENNRMKKYINGLIGMIPIAIIGFIAAPHLPISNILLNYENINWLDIRFCKDTFGFIGALETIYMCIFLWSFESGNFRHGEEYGSSKLVSYKTAYKYRYKENKEYSKAFTPKELKHRLNYRNNDNLPYDSNFLINLITKIRISMIENSIRRINSKDLELIECPTLFQYIKEEIKMRKENNLDDSGNNIDQPEETFILKEENSESIQKETN